MNRIPQNRAFVLTPLVVLALGIIPPSASAQIPPTCNAPPGVVPLIAPAEAANLGGNQVTLDWGPASGFPNKYEFVAATNPDFGPPLIYSDETFATDVTLTLSHSGTYTWKVRAKCNLGYIGPWSETRTFTLFVSPPVAITSLSMANCSQTGIQLQWFSPATAIPRVPAASYEIRRSSSPINESNWNSAVVVPNPPVPAFPGTLESFWVNGLSSCTNYYFAIKSRDPAQTWSAVSNYVGGATKCSPNDPCNVE